MRYISRLLIIESQIPKLLVIIIVVIITVNTPESPNNWRRRACPSCRNRELVWPFLKTLCTRAIVSVHVSSSVIVDERALVKKTSPLQDWLESTRLIWGLKYHSWSQIILSQLFCGLYQIIHCIFTLLMDDFNANTTNPQWQDMPMLDQYHYVVLVWIVFIYICTLQCFRCLGDVVYIICERSH